MQKQTKDLLLDLKAIRPHIHGVTHMYGSDWKTGQMEDTWFIDTPEPIKCANEKELQDKLKELIKSTESELGFRHPHTTRKMGL